MKIVILGLSITSTWGNGHATTYRSLLRALSARRHEILFLERDVEWYANHRDLAEPLFCQVSLYKPLAELKQRFLIDIRSADLVIIGSYIPEGAAVADWVTRNAQGPIAFYDIDTPVTFAKLAKGDHEHLSPDLVPRFDLYLSFTDGPLLDRLGSQFGARMVRPLYCSADPDIYFPQRVKKLWDLGYIGTYSADRHRQFERLLLTPANIYPSCRFIVAGSLYPSEVQWPPNLVRIFHLPHLSHRLFYNQQRFTLNLTRGSMVKAGFSPSVRLFEAAACELNSVKIEFRRLSVYDVGELNEKFDLVLFLGVLYHLRHPLLALDRIHEHVVNDILVFQSMQRGSAKVFPLRKDYDFWQTDIFEEEGFPIMYFIENRYAGDETNWWIPNRACAEAMLRSAGFTIVENPEEEVFICRRSDVAAGFPVTHKS
jgi:spore maturation protein CgeB